MTQIRAYFLKRIDKAIRRPGIRVTERSNEAITEALACSLATMLCTQEIPPDRFMKLDLGKLADAVLSASRSSVLENAREQLGP